VSAVLLFTYHLPKEPSAPRVAVWRALKKLPGHYLVDGLYALPISELYEMELLELVHDVRNYGGKAALFTATAVEGADLASNWTRARRRQGAKKPRRKT
jgi:hypothetical protein